MHMHVHTHRHTHYMCWGGWELDCYFIHRSVNLRNYMNACVSVLSASI
uniref:Uncharacterized protein n=1 Tax=Anguilla anguilla TaxID=7936 RepID=A0A0E9XNF0_ANGAN